MKYQVWRDTDQKHERQWSGCYFGPNCVQRIGYFVSRAQALLALRRLTMGNQASIDASQANADWIERRKRATKRLHFWETHDRNNTRVHRKEKPVLSEWDRRIAKIKSVSARVAKRAEKPIRDQYGVTLGPLYVQR